jgi:hypothetical protein
LNQESPVDQGRRWVYSVKGGKLVFVTPEEEKQLIDDFCPFHPGPGFGSPLRQGPAGPEVLDRDGARLVPRQERILLQVSGLRFSAPGSVGDYEAACPVCGAYMRVGVGRYMRCEDDDGSQYKWTKGCLRLFLRCYRGCREKKIAERLGFHFPDDFWLYSREPPRKLAQMVVRSSQRARREQIRWARREPIA